MILFEYRCDCGRIDEDFRASFEDAKVNEQFCKCGKAMKAQYPCPAIKNSNMDNLSMLDPRYADLRRKQCGVEV